MIRAFTINSSDYLYMIKDSFWFHERELKNHIVTNPRCKKYFAITSQQFWQKLHDFKWDLMDVFQNIIGFHSFSQVEAKLMADLDNSKA